MSTETKRANPNYEASAVNLVNHEAFQGMLQSLAESKASMKAIQERIDQLIPPELAELVIKYQDEIMQITSDIQMTIEERGSYQDLKTGRYAVKQRKISLSYDPAVFKLAYPTLAPAVIVEAVNVKALEGLVKGGLIKQDDLIKNGVVETKESFSYIIKV